MKSIDMICPQCGAILKPDRYEGKAVCEYCGYQMLIEKEDTLEEIRAKEQAKSYGYHKGRLRAEAEAEAVKKKKFGPLKISLLVFGAIVLMLGFASTVNNVTKPLVNPFDYIEVSFQGKDGDGEVVLEIKNQTEGIDANFIHYEFSKEDDLFQGETITIQATSEQYRLSENMKSYIVEGLDEYLKDLDNIPEEALELIHLRAESALELNLDRSKSAGFFIDMKPVKLFLLTDGKQTNQLYDAFEVHFSTNAGEKTVYVLAGFEDVIVRNGTQVSIDMSYGMYYGQLTQVQGWLWITAYNSLEEIRAALLTSQESYMELKELDL
uniref:hypothetical protein n=1 Tax=Acetatifactor sp. TaxID=1872090 RepID=UPI0040565061